MYMGCNRDWDEMTIFDKRHPILSGMLYGAGLGLLIGVLAAIALFL